VAALAVRGPIAAQPIEDPRPAWRTRTDAVWVFATVTDKDGKPIPDLTREDFRVFDDSIEQQVAQFSSERVPVSLGLVVDISESMRGRRMTEARSALDRFLTELLRPEDEVFLLAFNHAPRLVAPWALDPSTLRGRLDSVIPNGGTAIHDALARAVPELARRRHQRAALVVISDGADTASDRTLFETRSLLRRGDAFIYALAIEGANDRPSTRVNPEALRAFTDDSGGYTAVIKDVSQLGQETDRIARELNHQYLIGYAAPRPPDGQYHSIRVRLKTDGYFVRSRRGYIAARNNSDLP
jgi:Ca-activated chloride channel family protein